MEELKTVVALATQSFLSFLAVMGTFATICLVIFGIARILRDLQVFLLEKQALNTELEEKKKEEFEWKEDNEECQ